MPDMYMFLIRGVGGVGEYQSFSAATGTKAKMAAFSANLPKWLKGSILGESLDSPFVGFIKLTSVSHTIGDLADPIGYGDAGAEFATKGMLQDVKEAEREIKNDSSTTSIRERQQTLREKQAVLRGKVLRFGLNRNGRGSMKQRFSGNSFMANKLPEHGTVTVTKAIDRATPQLAYGCSAQERFPFAVIYYRRKTGVGIQGVRAPYLGVLLDKVMLSSWGLEDDSETVELRYERIAWAATTQVADMNVSVPGFGRYWDIEGRSGGQMGMANGLLALTAAFMVAGVGLGAGVEAAFQALNKRAATVGYEL